MYLDVSINLFVFALPLSVEELMSLETEDDREEKPALVPSLFPLIAPTLYFSTADEKGQDTHLCCRVKQTVALAVGSMTGCYVKMG